MASDKPNVIRAENGRLMCGGCRMGVYVTRSGTVRHRSTESEWCAGSVGFAQECAEIVSPKPLEPVEVHVCEPPQARLVGSYWWCSCGKRHRHQGNNQWQAG